MRGFNQANTVMLPDTYTRKDIPADPKLIPSKESISEWKHLKKIEKEMVTLKKCRYMG